jgi:hypothetical protein
VGELGREGQSQKIFVYNFIIELYSICSKEIYKN